MSNVLRSTPYINDLSSNCTAFDAFSHLTESPYGAEQLFISDVAIRESGPNCPEQRSPAAPENFPHIDALQSDPDRGRFLGAMILGLDGCSDNPSPTLLVNPGIYKKACLSIAAQLKISQTALNRLTISYWNSGCYNNGTLPLILSLDAAAEGSLLSDKQREDAESQCTPDDPVINDAVTLPFLTLFGRYPQLGIGSREASLCDPQERIPQDTLDELRNKCMTWLLKESPKSHIPAVVQRGRGLWLPSGTLHLAADPASYGDREVALHTVFLRTEDLAVSS